MKPGVKAAMSALLEPKAIILGLAVFNFTLIWVKASQPLGWICEIGSEPWYYPWSFASAPAYSLLAAFFLWLSRKWSYLIAIGLSAPTFVQGMAVYRDSSSLWAVLRYWRWAYESTGDFLTLIDAQYILAAGILACATTCLVERMFPWHLFKDDGI